MLPATTRTGASVEFNSPARDEDPPGPTLPATAVAATAASPGCDPSRIAANRKHPKASPTVWARELKREARSRRALMRAGIRLF